MLIDLDKWAGVIAAIGSLSAFGAALCSFFAVKESAKARRNTAFLDFYNSLVNLQENWASNQDKAEEKPRILQQLLNHYEVFAHLYNLKEIDQKLAKSLLRGYLIAEINLHRDAIEKTRKADPMAFTEILGLVREWKEDDKTGRLNI